MQRAWPESGPGLALREQLLLKCDSERDGPGLRPLHCWKGRIYGLPCLLLMLEPVFIGCKW